MTSTGHWARTLRVLRRTLVLFGIGVGTLQILRIGGFSLSEGGYFYWILGFFLGAAFLIYPSRRGGSTSDNGSVPWFDAILAIPVLGICAYLSLNALNITAQGWEFGAPPAETAMGFVLWALVLEAVRRATKGWVLFVVCLFFSLYPAIAGLMPGFLAGQSFTLDAVAAYHSFSTSSLVGTTTAVLANILVGYVLLGVVLGVVGGGEFLMRIAAAGLRRSPGGPAKVSVVSSGLFGSISGSPVSNVLTTGSITIPNMVRTGYRPSYAAGVESVASTGGTLMPPIMGTAAFLVASFLGIPYGDVVLAAIIPSLLYYASLLFQVDLYARKRRISAEASAAATTEMVAALDDTGPLTAPGDNPTAEAQGLSLRRTLADGWFFPLAIAVLIYAVFVWRQEAQAPYYATAVLVFGYVLSRRGRFARGEISKALDDSGRLLSQLTAILAGVGFVVGALSVTGLAGAMGQEMLALAGSNLYVLLALAAVASIILGTGMPVSACYVFLAITAAPGLVALGVDPLAAHLFVLYWGMISFITPPVAMAAITAGGIAHVSSFAAARAALRMASFIFVIPVAFVLNPAFLGDGTALEIGGAVVLGILGMCVGAAAFEGYVYGVGAITRTPRIILGVAALLILAPNFLLDLTGIGLAVLGVAVAAVLKARSGAERTQAASGVTAVKGADNTAGLTSHRSSSPPPPSPPNRVRGPEWAHPSDSLE